MKKNMIQFIKFGIVGASNTAISYIVYLAGIYCGLHYLLASILGFIVSVINSFYWNNRYVFRQGEEKRSLIKVFIKTFLSYASTGLVLNSFLLFIQIDVLAWSDEFAPLINLLITIPINFILNKFWAFK